MKFADQLTESAIPEWKDKYIDYKLGKKKLKYHYGNMPKDPLLKKAPSDHDEPWDNSDDSDMDLGHDTDNELDTLNSSNSVESFKTFSAQSHLAQLRKNNYSSRSNESVVSLARSSSTPVIPNLVTGANNKRNGSNGSTGSGGNNKNNRNGKNRRKKNQNKRSNNNKNKNLPKEKIVYSAFQTAAIKDFIENWLIAEELTKCNDFYLWLLDECGNKFGILQAQIRIYKRQKEKSLEVHHNDDNQSLKSAISDDHNDYGSLHDNDRHEMNSHSSDDNHEDNGDISLLSHQLHIRESFFTNIKDFLNQNNLMPSWPKMAFKEKAVARESISASPSTLSLTSLNTENRMDYSDQHVRNRSPSLSSILNPVKETFAYDMSLLSSEMTLSRAERLLSDAILEFYLFLQLVKTYRDLNVTGFRKMVKKFDKTLMTRELPRFMKFARDNYSLFRHVNNNIKLMAQHMRMASSYHVLTDLIPHNPKDDPLLWWETKAKSWYTKDLTKSPKDIKKNKSKLKKMLVQYTLNEAMIHRNNRSTAQMTVGCFFIGFAFSLLLYTLYLSFISPTLSYTRKILFPLWGGWYMTLFVLLLFQVNCFIWHRTGINYKFIMFGEVKARGGTQLFNNDFATSGISLKIYYLSFFIFISCICAALSFKLQELSPWSFICMVCMVTLFFVPSNIIPYWDKLIETKNWFIVTSIRLMLSGLYPVEFGDFFLGDIVCSLTYSIADIAMFSCIYATNEQGLCGSSHSKSMGILSSIPSAWRLMQCIRRFLDSGDWFPHLINGIKYSFGVGYQTTLCAYRLSPANETIRTYFIIISTMNSVLTCIWDLVIDWSLFQPSYRNLFLRDDLYLAGKRNWETGSYEGKRKAVYYAAMIWDILIRFQWVVYAVAPQTIQQSAKTSFILAITEVLRRFVWVIFRIENEHVANVHLFRVTGDSPLPYPVMHNTDSNNIMQEVNRSSFLLNKPISNNATSMIPSSAASVSLSNINHGLMEPSEAYHTMSRRKTTMFGKISNSIPWVHATDFQRPVATPMEDQTGPESGHGHQYLDSDTESESGM